MRKNPRKNKRALTPSEAKEHAELDEFIAELTRKDELLLADFIAQSNQDLERFMAELENEKLKLDAILAELNLTS